MRRVSWIVLWAATGATACGRGQAQPDTPPAQPADVSRMVVDSTLAHVPLDLPAQLYVEHDAYVLARTTGVVESVAVDLGDRVAKGQLIVSLEHVDQRIALDQARAAATNADQQVERARALGSAGALTVEDSERAELDARRAELALRQAQRDYDLTRIVAPFAGVVTARIARAGRLVQPNDSLARVTALKPLLASVQLPERVPPVKIGTHATVVSLDGVTGQALVVRESPTVDPSSGTREVVLRVTDAGGLSPGMTVHVRVGAEPHRVIAIPPDALNEDGYVLVWDRGRATLRSVVLGDTLPDGRIVVRSGLGAGETIVRTDGRRDARR
ncbi:MAG TPA: efflux RND transporter periplasmic adaptor subunit [Gemmatimonadales bacterium]|nr:efflux RND transporter periplasmic adaptor subunit [Gemmatimonadales bacterium]